MSNSNDENRKKDRREFLKEAGLAGLAAPVVAAGIAASACDDDDGGGDCQLDGGVSDPLTLWNEQGYFVHETVDASRFNDGEITARIEGEWQTFPNRRLSHGFLSWNLAARLEVIQDPMGFTCLDGPHSGALASYGQTRGDSRFSINNAFKGFGLVPKEEYLDETIELLMSNWMADVMVKLDILEGFYTDEDKWDRRLLDSLELYSNPTFCTHSFLNQYHNPIVSICFLAIPGSYEVRAIPRLLHWDDPDISEVDYKRYRYVDMIHDFFHGGPYPTVPYRIGVLYYIIEEFDNSPAPGLMGLRTVPPL